MIAKITQGKGFRGALDYLLNEKVRAEELARDEGADERRRHEQRGEHERGLEQQQQAPSEGEGLRDERREREEADERGSAGRGVERADKRAGVEHEIGADGGGRSSSGGDRGEEGPAYAEGARHRIIGGNMSGQTARELAREFGAVREVRPDIEKAVHHVSMTAAKGERLSAERWNEVAERYVERMGFANSPYVVIQHRDTDHDHIHVVASRIGLDGSVVNEWQSKQRAESVMREVERDYGLERVRPSLEVGRAAPTRGEIEHYARTGELSAKMRLQGYVEHALKDRPTATEFVERLERMGVEVVPNLQSTGRMSGISFRVDDELMKGSDLGRGFSWGGLQGRGLGYEVERDAPALLAAKEREVMRQAERGYDPAQTPAEYFVERASRQREVEEWQRARAEEAAPQQSRPDETAAAREQFVEGHELSGRRASVEELQRAAGGVEAQQRGADPLETLRRAAGVEEERGDPGQLRRLELSVGFDRVQEEEQRRSREREQQQEAARQAEEERKRQVPEISVERETSVPAVEKKSERESRRESIERDTGYGYSR